MLGYQVRSGVGAEVMSMVAAAMVMDGEAAAVFRRDCGRAVGLYRGMAREHRETYPVPG